jgi:hypothetical protein
MDVDDVCALLEEWGLSTYIPSFRGYGGGVDRDVLFALDEAQLTELGLDAPSLFKFTLKLYKIRNSRY